MFTYLYPDQYDQFYVATTLDLPGPIPTPQGRAGGVSREAERAGRAVPLQHRQWAAYGSAYADACCK